MLTETFDTGWRARVDGEDVQVERVDHALCGVWLKSGARRIELRYAPTSWSRGLACLAAGLAWLAASLGWSLRRSS